MNAFVLALGMFALAASYADTLVTSCQVGSGKTIQLIKGKEITQDVGVYYLVQNGKQKPLFGSLSTSTGSVISSRCIGTTRGVLMVAGEFSSNYTQGVVVGYDQGANRIQRLDFAERALPRWVYLNKTSIKVLIPNEGNEQPGKYLLYESGGKRAVEGHGTDEMPSKRGFEVVDLAAPPA